MLLYVSMLHSSTNFRHCNKEKLRETYVRGRIVRCIKFKKFTEFLMLNQDVAGDGEMIVQVLCLVDPHACRSSWDKSCIESELVPVNGVCEI